MHFLIDFKKFQFYRKIDQKVQSSVTHEYQVSLPILSSIINILLFCGAFVTNNDPSIGMSFNFIVYIGVCSVPYSYMAFTNYIILYHSQCHIEVSSAYRWLVLHLPIPSLPTPDNHKSFSVCSFCLSEMSYSWICNLFRLVSFTWKYTMPF